MHQNSCRLRRGRWRLRCQQMSGKRGRLRQCFPAITELRYFASWWWSVPSSTLWTRILGKGRTWTRKSWCLRRNWCQMRVKYPLLHCLPQDTTLSSCFSIHIDRWLIRHLRLIWLRQYLLRDRLEWHIDSIDADKPSSRNSAHNKQSQTLHKI